RQLSVLPQLSQPKFNCWLGCRSVRGLGVSAGIVESEQTRMDSGLLQNLMVGAGSNSQLIGGLIIALLYVVVGLLGAIGSIVVFRRIFQGRWEQIFWTCFLAVIAAFYLSFAAYFEASTLAWQTELVGVAIFFVCAVGGLVSRYAIAVGY